LLAEADAADDGTSLLPVAAAVNVIADDGCASDLTEADGE